MKKFAVFSGFLGSGKTTTMMALTGGSQDRAAMISNDLGSLYLADHKQAELAGCNTSQLTGECICYQTENLVARLDSLFARGHELVISDIPGFGVGALEHVYHTLQAQYPGRYSLAPFTVLTEPEIVEQLRSGSTGELHYILNAQLVEADLIVLNKCDLICPEQAHRDAAWLENAYPQARVIPISAMTGQGVEELAQALRIGTASLRRPDIGYGGAAFAGAMGKLSEYYAQYYVNVCCNDFDGSAYLMAMAEQVRRGIQQAGFDIPHLKLLAWEPEGDYGKADLIGVHRPVRLTRAFVAPCTQLAVILNASALCPGEFLEEIMTQAQEAAAQQFGLTQITHRKECFGMGS